MCLGIPGQIVAIEDEAKQLGVRRIVNLALVQPEAEPLSNMIGTWVLIHVGFAMSCIDEQEARRTLMLLEEMGELFRGESKST